jgi:hypothetical protein
MEHDMKKDMKKMMGGGYMKPMGMKEGGGMKMVEKDGKKVPAFAADGVGKMAMGGKVKKMEMGGKCRGMGAASKGGQYRMG